MIRWPRLRWPAGWPRPSAPVLAALVAAVALVVGAVGMVIRDDGGGQGSGPSGSRGGSAAATGDGTDRGRGGDRSGRGGEGSEARREAGRSGGDGQRADRGGRRPGAGRPGRTPSTTRPRRTPTTTRPRTPTTTRPAGPTTTRPPAPPTTVPGPVAPFPVVPGVPTHGLLLADVRCWAEVDQLYVTGRIRNLSYPSDLVDLEVSFVDAFSGEELDWDSELFDLPPGATETFDLSGVADAELEEGLRCAFTAG